MTPFQKTHRKGGRVRRVEISDVSAYEAGQGVAPGGAAATDAAWVRERWTACRSRGPSRLERTRRRAAPAAVEKPGR